ncbi:hypothetical protein T265_03668 [Opisthorchis viverrini]|uniref:Uncharacterized protein n=1 Tax=Opisthorchis viverrini TaxID=6198 RepID=A0A074ZRP1_OPIVI|nr:hypothetical protein T265_03668 [Opisthorchis viverrini]KER29756.1 hypothetical protein T265_03668 [Opisthorchis viverrini]
MNIVAEISSPSSSGLTATSGMVPVACIVLHSESEKQVISGTDVLCARGQLARFRGGGFAEKCIVPRRRHVFCRSASGADTKRSFGSTY